MCISMLIAPSLCYPLSSARMSRLICVIPNDGNGVINTEHRVLPKVCQHGSGGSSALEDRCLSDFRHWKRRGAFFTMPTVFCFFLSLYWPHSKPLQCFMVSVLHYLLLYIHYLDSSLSLLSLFFCLILVSGP